MTDGAPQAELSQDGNSNPASLSAMPASRPVSARWGPRRLARLTLKELREILRDRRTVITLVLMPLLVYPLLAIVFQRFVGSAVSTEPQELAIGFESAAPGVIMAEALKEAEALGQGRFNTSLADDGKDGATRRGGRFKALPKFYEVQATADAVSSGFLDVGLRLPRQRNSDSEGELVVDLYYRPGSVNSEAARRYLESRLDFLNVQLLRQQVADLGGEPNVSVTLKPMPVPDLTSSGTMGVMGTLLPLVLIVMSITGAVYPAIDLTAGERERGTLEALVAAPVPRLGLLISKYIAVVVVSLLTAGMNLVSMIVTVVLLQLGEMLFGHQGISLLMILQVAGLLFLFALFFSAVLMVVTSFARSFKEAQAYVVPLMLVSLGPALVSLLPEIKLSNPLAVTPLVGIVLLTRDTFASSASPLSAMLVIVSTLLYSTAALALAAKVFGTDAVLYGSPTTWVDAIRRPRRAQPVAGVAEAMICLVVIFPAYFFLSQWLAIASKPSFTAGKADFWNQRLLITAGMTALLFGGFPLAAALRQRVRLRTGFRLVTPPWTVWPAALVLGLSLWPLAYEIVLLNKFLGITTIGAELSNKALEFANALQAVPTWLILFSLAVTPAVFEELCFRGYLFAAIGRNTSPRLTILSTALLFGMFHVVVVSSLSIERLLPSTAMGLVLGWLAYRSGSVLPGILLHTVHNGLMLLTVRYKDVLAEHGWALQQQSHLPITWLLASLAAVMVAALILWLGTRKSGESSTPAGLAMLGE